MSAEMPLCEPIDDCRAWRAADFAEEALWVRHFTTLEIEELEAMGRTIAEGSLAAEYAVAIQAAIPSVVPLVLELAETMAQGKGFRLCRGCPRSAGVLS